MIVRITTFEKKFESEEKFKYEEMFKYEKMAKFFSKLCEVRLGLILWERGGNATVQHEGKEERGRICVVFGRM